MKKVISVLMAVILTVSCFALAFSVSAADYPYVSTYTKVASIGENVPILFTYYPAFNNEKIEIVIYNSKGTPMGSADFEFNNKYASSIQHFTVNWDTTGYNEGRYTIEVRKFFYSYYDWNETPTSSTFYITLIDDLDNGDPNRNAYSGSKEVIKKSSFERINAKKNTLCSAYSAWDEISINGCKLRLEEMYLGSTASTMISEENPYNPKANSNTNWIFTKFKLYNGTDEEVEASDFISMFDLYKSTGSKATTLDTATMGGYSTGHYSEYNVTVQPGETEDFYFAVLMPKSQGMPYLKIGNVYLNMNPSASKTVKHYYENKVVKATTSKNGSITTACSVCGDKKTTTIYYPQKVSLSETKVTYTGNAIKPEVKVKGSDGKVIASKYYTVTYSNNKNVGTATVTIKFKGNYSGTITKTFKINPKGTKVSKLTAKSKAFTASWKKQTTQVTGYILQYSTSAKFTEKTTKSVKITNNSTATKTISSLKAGTKYYVRIRTYKTVGKAGYYSDWSEALSIKTKK